jgi:hypothetical protein
MVRYFHIGIDEAPRGDGRVDLDHRGLVHHHLWGKGPQQRHRQDTAALRQYPRRLIVSAVTDGVLPNLDQYYCLYSI